MTSESIVISVLVFEGLHDINSEDNSTAYNLRERKLLNYTSSTPLKTDFKLHPVRE